MSDKRVIVLDTETTGFSPVRDRVIEVAVLDFNTGEVLIDTKLNPQMPIPPDSTLVHGITDEMVADAPLFASIVVQLASLISQSEAVIGYNPWFDRNMINGEFQRYNSRASAPDRDGSFESLAVNWPTLVCAKRTWDIHEPKEKRHLQNAFKRFVNKDGFEGAHGALADARATRSVYFEQQSLFKLVGVPWNELDPEQKRWVGPSDHLVVDDGIVKINFGKHQGKDCFAVERGYWSWISSSDFPEHVRAVAAEILSGRCKTAQELYSFAYGKF